MAEEEEGEITETEITEEEENNEEPITAEDLKQMSEENDVLIEDILENKPEDQIVLEADNEEGDVEDSVMEGEEKEQGDTIADATEGEGMEEEETKEEGMPTEIPAEEAMAEEGTADEGMPDEGKEDVEQKEEDIIEKGVIEEKLDKPPESVALKGRIDDKTMKRLEQVEKEVNEAANSIYILKGRAEELLKKEKMSENEEKELEEVNAELKRQMNLFDEKTKEIQDIIANTNILETMPVRLPQVKHEEDVLPRVLLCGEIEDEVPKLIVCHQKSKGLSGITRECMSECPGSSPPTATSSRKKKCGNDDVQKAISVENSDVGKIRSLLEEDISNKDKILDGLKASLANLQNEIKMVSAENTELSERLKKLQQNQTKQKQQSCVPREPKKLCPSLMTAKLKEYSEYTRRLEKQLEEMETDFKNVHKEICAAQKERMRSEQMRNSVAKQFCKKK